MYVETLIVLPILIVLIFGGVAMGVLMVTYFQLANAATLTMQQMMVDGYYSSRAQQVLADALRNAGISPSSVTVYGTPYPPRPYGEQVSLRIIYNHRINLPFLQQTVPIDLTVSGTSVYLPPQ